MKEPTPARLVSLASAVEMFRQESWPCLVRGLPEAELSTGIARYLNRVTAGHCGGRTERPTLSTSD